VIGIEAFLSLQDEWLQWQREKEWDVALEASKLGELVRRSSDAEAVDHELLCGDPSCAVDVHLKAIAAFEDPQFWTCEDCDYGENVCGTNRCLVCRNTCRKWKCFGCTSMNDIGKSCCKLCSSSFVRSSLVEKHLKQLHVAKLAQAAEQVINIFVFEKYSLSFLNAE
jgi:hypothetical protein